MMAPGKKKLPQGGTGRSAAGESSAGPSGPVCPSYSGGGNQRHSSARPSRVNLSRSGSEADAEPTSDGDASSLMSTEELAVGAVDKSYRKRPRAASQSPEGDSRPASGSRSGSASKRGRGRPPTTGKYVGAAKAQAELRAAYVRQAKEANEEEIRNWVEISVHKDIVRERAQDRDSDDSGTSACERTASRIKESIGERLNIVRKVAQKSRNLKGEFVHILKEAVARISADVELLGKRTISEENALLQDACKQLKADNDRLSKDLQDLRREVLQMAKQQGAAEAAAAARAPPSTLDAEVLTRNILGQVGTMVSAQFAAMDDRLLPEPRLRPPLAADRKRADSSAPAVSLPAAKKPAQAVAAQADASKKPKKRKVADQPQPSTSAATDAPEATTSASPILTEEGWSTVAKRGKKKKPEAPNKPSGGPKKGQSKKAPKKAPKKKRAPRLRAPRSSAVVITLQPGAVERGLSYAAVLATAMDKVPLADIGITDLRFRQAVSGARIFELPGAESGEKADALAAKLREALGAEDVRVSRPTKCAEMRISGLDDCATSESVAAAVARTGGCTVGEVKAGEVRRTPSGLGSVWVRCPVAAAKKVAQGRLLVGWVSAQVKLLEARPTRCFRCLLNGHVQHVCTSEVDRRTQCYRCGEVGHLAKLCARDPHCTACAAAGLKADHPIGTKPCGARVPRKGMGKAAVSRSTPAPAATGGEVVPMSS